MKVIELNDSAIKVGDASGIIAYSPGFALADGDSLLLGEAAEQQARLKPTSSYNKYWHELSLEPILVSSKIRHFADIAYAHLLHLAEIGDIDSDVIFAVPGNFTREQLAILLGLAQQSPLNPVGVIDSAVAAAVSAAQSRSVIYMDLQLHQAVLTRLSVSGQELKSDSVIQVPGVGSQNFMDMMMQLATGLFIQQCRFNPQHNAESEQQLYNALPFWLQQDDEEQGNLILELTTASASHRAKMPRESLVNQLQGHYKKIHEQIKALATDHDVQLILSSRLASLPGFSNSLKEFPSLVVVDDRAINSACLEYRDLITGQEGGIHLVDALPVASSTDTASAADLEDNLPTHALYGSRAYPVDGIEITAATEINGHQAAARKIVLADAELPAQLGSITRSADGVYLDSGEQELLLNRSKVSGKQRLKLGDSLQFGAPEQEIKLIRVNDV